MLQREKHGKRGGRAFGVLAGANSFQDSIRYIQVPPFVKLVRNGG
jgi:hypothetical protein